LKERGGKKKKKTKSVNTQIFPLTRFPFSASLYFTPLLFLPKLRSSDNSAHFFLLERGHSSCLFGRKELMKALRQGSSQNAGAESLAHEALF